MAAFTRFLAGLVGIGQEPGAAIAAELARRIAAEGGGRALGLSPRGAGVWDRLIDAMNRLPRPLMALGTFALVAAALVDPVWFSARMEALADMPEPLWWLIGAVVSLFFGARFQAHEQDFAREMLERAAAVAKDAARGPEDSATS